MCTVCPAGSSTNGSTTTCTACQQGQCTSTPSSSLLKPCCQQVLHQAWCHLLLAMLASSSATGLVCSTLLGSTLPMVKQPAPPALTNPPEQSTHNPPLPTIARLSEAALPAATCKGFVFDDNLYLRQYLTDTNETTTLGNMFPTTRCSGAAWPAYSATSYLDCAFSLTASKGTSVFVVEPSLHVITRFDLLTNPVTQTVSCLGCVRQLWQ